MITRAEYAKIQRLFHCKLEAMEHVSYATAQDRIDCIGKALGISFDTLRSIPPLLEMAIKAGQVSSTNPDAFVKIGGWQCNLADCQFVIQRSGALSFYYDQIQAGKLIDGNVLGAARLADHMAKHLPE